MFRAAAAGPYDEAISTSSSSSSSSSAASRATPCARGQSLRACILLTRNSHADKATDENLTSEDWGKIMEVCDRVQTDPNGSKEAVQSMIKRLAHRNANVQLYTLEVSFFFGLVGVPLF